MKVLLMSTFLVFSLLLFLSSSSSSSRVLFPSSTGSFNPAGTMEDDETSSGDQHPPSQAGESLDNSGKGALSEEEGEEGLGGFMEGRMVIESNDYPGTGANNRHDPKPPTT